MELATPHHPDRACRLTRPARLIGAHLQLGGKIEKSSLWPRWSSLPAVRRDDSCLERNRAPRGPQRMLTESFIRRLVHNGNETLTREECRKFFVGDAFFWEAEQQRRGHQHDPDPRVRQAL